MKTRKKLKNRCPKCGSSQIHYRKMLDNWICDEKGCRHIFKTPKDDSNG